MEKELSKEQQSILDEIIENPKRNFFITGGAGTGKSILIENIEKKIKTKKNKALLAFTNIAARNIEGETIHSYFRIDPNKFRDATNTGNQEWKKDRSLKIKIEKLEMIIIDEISMVSCDLFDQVNDRLRYFRKLSDSSFFYGVQIILVGDLYQLSPVIKKEEREILKKAYNDNYYFFNSEAFKEAKDEFRYCLLKENHRQDEDKEFAKNLNMIRIGKNNDEISDSLNYLNTRAKNPIGEHVEIVPKNKIAKIKNEKELDKINGKTYYSKVPVLSKEYYEKENSEENKPMYPLEDLEIKIGAKVMTMSNLKGVHENGTLCRVIDVVSRGESINKIKLKREDNGSEFFVNKHLFSYKKDTGMFTKISESVINQFPVKLAWAFTAHKSQGSTYEKVHVNFSDTSNMDLHGLLYVALSRCKTLNGLTLQKEISKNDIDHDRKVNIFMDKYFSSNVCEIEKDETKSEASQFVKSTPKNNEIAEAEKDLGMKNKEDDNRVIYLLLAFFVILFSFFAIDPLYYFKDKEIKNEKQEQILIKSDTENNSNSYIKNCNIKGNISTDGTKKYHTIESDYYNQTNPEEIFCSEEEAQKAGYRKAFNMPKI
jgi:predicted ATPase